MKTVKSKTSLETELEIPNKKTKTALTEHREMKKNKKKYKRYSSFSELLNDIK